MESKEFAEGRELFLDTLQKMSPDAGLQKVIDGLRVPVREHEPNVMVVIGDVPVSVETEVLDSGGRFG